LIDSAAPGNTELSRQTELSTGLWAELWVSLASLLRSYTAAHGLHSNREAEVAWDEAHIVARHGEKSLNLRREGASVAWVRENGDSGTLELTEGGRLRGPEETDEDEMDMAAERWARELMR
jgi:hypothetical protein